MKTKKQFCILLLTLYYGISQQIEGADLDGYKHLRYCSFLFSLCFTKKRKTRFDKKPFAQTKLNLQ